MVYKERFINPDQINDSIALIKKMAVEQGFHVVLIGGVALQVYGSPKLTKDIDFALDQPLEDQGTLRKTKPISFGGARYAAPNGAMIDLIVRNDEYAKLYEDAIVSSIETPEGIPIVTPEHLAAMKLAAGREHDILALKWMIRQADLLDIKKTRALVYRFMGRYAQDRFDDIVDQAGIEKEMKRRRERDPEEE
jgi:hypothetical protein